MTSLLTLILLLAAGSAHGQRAAGPPAGGDEPKPDTVQQETWGADVSEEFASDELSLDSAEAAGADAQMAAGADAQMAAGADAQSGEQAISLDDLEEAEATEPAAGHPPGHPGAEPTQGRAVPFRFKLFFDLLLEYEFERDIFQFAKDHAYVVLELTATDWLSFRTDVALEPHFFELVFHFGQTAELRLGKVLVPFGQNEFHHLIGGRVDEYNLFLPDIWGDYGLAFKHLLYDGEVVGFDYSVWVINGFQEATERVTNLPWPRIAGGSPLGDNNIMKGMGLRPALRLANTISAGTSWYLDIYNDYSEPMTVPVIDPATGTPAMDPLTGEPQTQEVSEAQYLLFYGFDVDFGFGTVRVPVLEDLRLRGEIAWGEVMIPKENWVGGLLSYYGSLRMGYNLELSYRIVRWLIFRYRFGYLDPDDRVEDALDLMLHEPGFVATVGPVQFFLLAQLLDPGEPQYAQRYAQTPGLYNSYVQEEEGRGLACWAGSICVPYASEPLEYSRLYARVLFRY